MLNMDFACSKNVKLTIEETYDDHLSPKYPKHPKKKPNHIFPLKLFETSLF